jgi:hypothetical protein
MNGWNPVSGCRRVQSPLPRSVTVTRAVSRTHFMRRSARAARDVPTQAGLPSGIAILWRLTPSLPARPPTRCPPHCFPRLSEPVAESSAATAPLCPSACTVGIRRVRVRPVKPCKPAQAEPGLCCRFRNLQFGRLISCPTPPVLAAALVRCHDTHRACCRSRHETGK